MIQEHSHLIKGSKVVKRRVLATPTQFKKLDLNISLPKYL